jgi:pimeloyl-ACP methyl ester carboxylesterase
LQYLSTEQALADLASFRNFIQDKYQLTDANRWVTFGGSYPGALSAWARLKYPDLFYAAVASSAPIQATVDFYQYLEVVNKALASYSVECPMNVKTAFQKMQQLMGSLKGKSQLKKMFK